jgi:hypothetical protein
MGRYLNVISRNEVRVYRRGSCEQGNEPSGYIKGAKFTELLCEYQLSKIESTQWS